MTATREVPHATTLERELLAACISAGTRALDACGTLQASEFHHPAHVHIFAALRAIAEADEPIEVATLERHLNAAGNLRAVGGMAYLCELLDGSGSVASVPYYARTIRGTAAVRKMLATLGECVAHGYEGHDPDEYLAMVQRKVFEVGFREDRETCRPIKALVREAIDRYSARLDAKSELTGVTTGYAGLDGLLCGLQSKTQVIIAARPSMGKTALAMEIAHNTAAAGAPTVVYSLEMSSDALTDRMLCAAGGMDSQLYRRGQIHADRVVAAAQRVASLASLRVDDQPANLGELRTRARRWRSKNASGKGVVFVDYLQLIESEAGKRNTNREREVAEFSRGLKAMAKELDVCVVALAQVGRECEKRENKRPMLSDLRESGAIEADADVILFLFREAYYDPKKDPGVCEVICAKQRNGPIDTVKLAFDETTGRFTDPSRRSEF